MPLSLKTIDECLTDIVRELSDKEPEGVWQPQPIQEDILVCKTFEILMGGARGGGKTEVGIVWLVEPKYIHHPQYRALVLRKNFNDLSDWIDRATPHFAAYGGVLRGGVSLEFRFPNGAKIRLGHLRDKKSYSKYIGHQYHKILTEELTLIDSEKDYVKVVGSCRSAIPELKPQILNSTNPGNVGHGWVKRRFVSCAPYGVEHQPADLAGRTRIYIPMKLEDNPVLMKADPDYVKFLEGLKETDPALYKAWRHGDWDSFEGQYFNNFSNDLHVIKPFKFREIEIKRRVICLDYGYSAPSAVYWLAEMTSGEVYCYRELYKTQLTYTELGAMIMEYTPEEERHNATVVADPSIINKRGEHSHSSGKEQMIEGGLELALYGAKNARVDGWQVVRDYLQPRMNGMGEKIATLKIFDTCRNLIRTLPEMVHDDKKPEDLDTNTEDHSSDALRYGLVELNGGFTDYKKLDRMNIDLIRQDENPLNITF